MGATYTRQSSATIVDGTTIEAAHFNNEFDQLVAAFAVSSGHTHDGTTAEGGAITKLLGTAITIGDATAGTDITVTFDGESNDGVLAWMEDEDYFKFSDDILLNSTERLNFGDTGTYIFQSTDGQLDIVADTELQIAATTVDINGNVDISGTLTVAGAVDFGDAALSNVGAVQLDSISGDGDTNTSITFSGSDVITIATGGASRLTIGDGALSPVTNNQIDLGTASLEFKDGYFDGTVTADAFAGPLTGNVTGNVSGTAATVTTAAQSNITSLGTLTTLTVDNIITNGTTIGHTDDTDLLTLASGVLTVAGELDAVSLDISGDADIDGTLEADAITIGGITLAETIADTVGAMVTSNTESGITVAYDDADNTLDFTVGTLNQNTTGSAATLTTARTIGGTSFDGSANIAVGLAATATALASARTIGGTSFDGSANISVGLAATATALATARTIAGQSFDGSANITIASTDLSNTSNITLNDGTQTLTNKTLTSAVLNTGVSGTAILDEDNMASNSATQLATQQSIKAYVDTTVAATNEVVEDTTPQLGGDLDLNSNDITGTGNINITGTTTVSGDLIVDTNTLYVDSANNRVGIGTSMDVVGNILLKGPSTEDRFIEIGANRSDNGYSFLDFVGDTTYPAYGLRIIRSNTGANTPSSITHRGTGVLSLTTQEAGDIEFKTSNAERMRIDSDGKVGIGTSSPSEKLEVSGALLTDKAYITETTLTDGATVAWDMATQSVCKLTLGGNRTISAPTNGSTGQFASILAIQDGTGSRTITWNAVYEFTADTAPTLTTTASLGDLFVFRYNGAKWLEVGRNLNLTLA